MATSKKRNDELMQIAEYVLTHNNTGLLKDGNTRVSNDSYDGKIAGFGVSIVMSGLLPTLAIYYSKKESEDLYLRNILDVIAKMIKKDRGTDCSINDAVSLLRYAINTKLRTSDCDILKREILECSIALKQVFRTYME